MSHNSYNQVVYMMCLFNFWVFVENCPYLNVIKFVGPQLQPIVVAVLISYIHFLFPASNFWWRIMQSWHTNVSKEKCESTWRRG